MSPPPPGPASAQARGRRTDARHPWSRRRHRVPAYCRLDREPGILGARPAGSPSRPARQWPDPARPRACSWGQVASASPSRMPGRTPAASAAVTDPTSASARVVVRAPPAPILPSRSKAQRGPQVKRRDDEGCDRGNVCSTQNTRSPCQVAAKGLPNSPIFLASGHDLGRRTDHQGETRYGVEQVDLSAELDVGLQAGQPVGARVQAGQRIGPGSGDHLGSDRRIAGLAGQRLDDPAGAVRIVECKRALEARAENRDVSPGLARRAHERGEVEQRAEQHDLAARGRGEDRARARSSSSGSASAPSAAARTRAAKRRRRTPRPQPRCARRRLRLRRRARPGALAPPRSRRSRARARSRTRAPARSRTSPESRRRRSRPERRLPPPV